MTTTTKTIALISAFFLLAGCQKAVKAPVESLYRIQGSKQSPIYPVDVKQNSEDVLIQLQADAPLPEITSLDLAGNKIPFNFHIVNNTIVVPGKFAHLRLTHATDETIDILQEEPKN